MSFMSLIQNKMMSDWSLFQMIKQGWAILSHCKRIYVNIIMRTRGNDTAVFHNMHFFFLFQNAVTRRYTLSALINGRIYLPEQGNTHWRRHSQNSKPPKMKTTTAIPTPSPAPNHSPPFSATLFPASPSSVVSFPVRQQPGTAGWRLVWHS